MDSKTETPEKPRNTLTLAEMGKALSSDFEARMMLQELLWPDGPRCPDCGSDNVQSEIAHKSMTHRCRTCKSKKMFSLKSSIPMLRYSKLSYVQLLYAIHKLLSNPKGVTSVQLSKEMHIHQGSAWRLGHKIRDGFASLLTRLIEEIVADGDPEDENSPAPNSADAGGKSEDGNTGFSGPVEYDETYAGGKESNKHSNKKTRPGGGVVGKIPIIGALDRETNLVTAQVMDKVNQKTVHEYVYKTSKPGAEVYTDEARVYRNLKDRKHSIVNHSKGEYVNNEVHTNGIESFWALFKRSYMGTHHYMSRKHINRYVSHLAGLWNLRGLDIREKMSVLLMAMAEK